MSDLHKVAARIAAMPADPRLELEMRILGLVGKRVRVTYAKHQQMRKEDDPIWHGSISGTVIGVAERQGVGKSSGAGLGGATKDLILRYGNTQTLVSISFRKIEQIREI